MELQTPIVPSDVRVMTDTVTEEPEKSKANSPAMWRARIARCKKKRKELVEAWSENVDFRRGKPFHQESDVDRVNVNLDWSLTKGKHAQLYSQTPQVYLTPKREEFKAAVPIFGKFVNERLTTADVGGAVDEAVLDAINASGVGVAFVSYQSKTQQIMMPGAVDPLTGMAGEAIPTQKVIDAKFNIERLSPSDFLWPDEFTGSNFDKSPWLGRSDRMLWDEAQVEFGLDDEDKEEVCGSSALKTNLRDDIDTQNEDLVVEFDEVFYWAYKFDRSAQYFKQIRRMVFVGEKKDPVIDEEWKGQQFIQNGYLGACEFPIRVLTLTYISDDAIPPSDSAIGRPQVLEMIVSRTQMKMQRDRSMPIRWFDVNRIDIGVQDSLMRGTFQGFVPVQGDGSRSIGEVARANYPTDDYKFDGIIKGDLQEQWQLGSNQLGVFAEGERSASEANIIQRNFQSRIGYERARVANFFTGIARVLAGLMALYDTFPMAGMEDLQKLEGWNRKQISQEFVYYIRPDSTVLVDAEQRIEQLMKVLNLVGKTGFVNPQPIIEEIVALSALDPAKVMTMPQPPAPEMPKIAYTFKGEDFGNPIALAILMRSGQAPSPEELAAAKKLLAEATLMDVPPDPTAAPALPPQLTPQMGDASPTERITKRVEELGG